MACRAIHSWTFCALVGAFLDLALAYFMLCGAALAFLAAKFLGFFGLRLPCPCGGLFGRPSGHCLQHLSVECPPQIISSVQMSVRSRFPFDSVWAEEEGSPSHFDVKLVRDEAQSNRLLEMPREEAESCGSVSNLNVVKSQNWSSAGPSSVNKGDRPEIVRSPWHPRGGSDVKGKGVFSSLKPRLGLRRRRRAAAEQRRLSPIMPCDPQPGWEGAQHSYHSMGEQMQEISGDNVTTSGDRHPLSDDLKPSDSGMVEGDIPAIGSTQQLTICEAAEKDSVTGAPEELAFERNEVNVITILEQALKEEKAVRSALYLELEKERSAASTAADEAMAMILRLQKEKASIEMEARQYQRMVEEKTAYDEEEMNILKEIIVRREREKHVLEKEVELYRHMMVFGEGSKQQPLDELHNTIDMIAQRPGCSSEFADGPKVMLQQFSEPTIEKETSNCDTGHLDSGPPIVIATSDDIRISDCASCKMVDNGTHSAGNENNLSGHCNEQQSWGLVEEGHYLEHGHDKRFQSFDEHHVKVLEGSDEYHRDFQEKGMLTVDVCASSQQSQTSGYGDDSSLYKLNKSQENVFQNEASVSIDKFGENGAEVFGRFPCAGIEWENHQDTGEVGCKSYALQSEAEQSIHDVHVIDAKSCEKQNEKGNDISQVGSASVSSRTNDLRFESDENRMVDISRGHSSNSWSEAEQNVHRSSSDLTGILLSLSTSRDGSSFSELRRNSMSAVGKERLKLETEVECLRERLKIVQQGREKLNFSVENKDKENLQLLLLEEIASQLREIRQLTEPGKVIRQVSLPPPSPQVNSKKRRCRSVPWGVHRST